MKKLLLSFLVLFLVFKISIAQNVLFPQSNINTSINNAYKTSFKTPSINLSAANKPQQSNSAYNMLAKIEQLKNTNWQNYTHSYNSERIIDTVYVGVVPHDTLVITGTYLHNGPIFIFNDGVLFIHNSNFTNYGDVYVFGTGKLISDSSSLTFPQQYFYQRSLVVVQHGIAYFNHCSFDYSGVQHNLVIGDSGVVGMNDVHQRDWTTSGLFGEGSIFVHGLNLGGEYILTDSSNSYFSNVDTLLLWHKFPQTAVVNHSFPQGDTVMNYYFNNTLSNVSGVKYNVFADSCHTVWWGMMPVNGSNVTISNSNIRAIGCWFEHGDSLTINGLYNNTFYPNTIIPMADRNLHLLNSFVQTWSLYVFDTSQLNILNSTVGEVGTQQHSSVLSQQFLLDGSGGYFWATDTSVIFANNVTVYSTVRSERNGIFVLAYSTLPFSAPSAISNSVMICVQNNLAADPIPYDGSIAWMENIESPSTAHADSLITINGSSWIDQGPNGSWMDFQSYSLYYQLLGDTVWTAIVVDSTSEVHHNALAHWNTNGLSSGTYILRLVVHNDLTDSVEDFKAITLLPSLLTSINDNENNMSASLFPIPSGSFAILKVTVNKSTTMKITTTDVIGKELEVLANTNTDIGTHTYYIDTNNYSSGIYFYTIITNENSLRGKIVVKH